MTLNGTIKIWHCLARENEKHQRVLVFLANYADTNRQSRSSDSFNKLSLFSSVKPSTTEPVLPFPSQIEPNNISTWISTKPMRLLFLQK